MCRYVACFMCFKTMFLKLEIYHSAAHHNFPFNCYMYVFFYKITVSHNCIILCLCNNIVLIILAYLYLKISCAHEFAIISGIHLIMLSVGQN